MRAAILAAALVLIPANSWALAVFENGNALHEKCQGPAGDPGVALCFGYIIGVADSMASNGVEFDLKCHSSLLSEFYQHHLGGWRACLPDGVQTQPSEYQVRQSLCPGTAES